VAAGRSWKSRPPGAHGLNLGLASAADDILDYTADERTLGKPIMNDLREAS
jgi:geranylgeranyl pyrophosphate synthase